MVLPVLSGRDTAITVSVGATNALYAALLRVLLIISDGRAVKKFLAAYSLVVLVQGYVGAEKGLHIGFPLSMTTSVRGHALNLPHYSIACNNFWLI